jgi:hypothetical protein
MPGIEIAEFLVIVVGGGWALYNYRLFRRAQAKVGIEPLVRIHGQIRPGESHLLVKIRITNTANVLFRHDEAVATLMDASERTEDGRLLLVPFAREEFLVPVHGSMTSDAEAIRDGKLFSLSEHEPISLEPGEFVDSDTAFLLRGVPPMLGLRVSVRGWQGKWGRRPYWWGSFSDPDLVEQSVGTSEPAG